MKKIVFFVSTFVICLGVSFLAFDQIDLKKTNVKERIQIKTQNEEIVDKNINILKLPLPNADQRKYSVKKLPINGGQIEIKKLNNKS
ncbi:hypothetical protein V7148_17900 [Gottfriedia acidiceleris]|uniref:hypothetical protein n=1 Tax=Bacillaceae TaxID=186817 RepID=UPI000BEBFDF3|nr:MULTISPECIES: hypothetical protein [unclassified Bacillus (in: firmicutes)]PEC47730.1 hypothetical protein CON00_20175 [Bacillus sp. AFS096315]PFM83018.1 hypothetical protein COJ46_04245 [Bacillus sp. AFS077874]